MNSLPIDYLLRTRAVRSRPDTFVRNTVMIGLVVWLALSGLSVLAYQEAYVVRGFASCLLFLVTVVLMLTLPIRQVQKDAAVHTSFYGGRCYQEILGSLIRPREILDQVAWHSARTYVRTSTPWALLIVSLWMLVQPSLTVEFLRGLLLWIPGSTLFVWATSYPAQQFAIYNSRARDGLVASLGESLVRLVTAVPVGLCLLVALIAMMTGRYWVMAGCVLGYLGWTMLVCRLLAATGIERLPDLRHKVGEFSRRWLGRRNRYVLAWSDNPIVVRERKRDAGRVPGQLLGALLWQFPLAGAVLLLAGSTFPEIRPAEYANAIDGILVLCGGVQMCRASRRCSGAIVAEVESQTLESMQNTRLHARELLSGWLQVGTYPRLLESLVILVCLMFLSGGSIAPLSALAFLLAPGLGAALGLAASCAANRQTAARVHSESMMSTAFGYFLLVFVYAVVWSASWTIPWSLLLVLHMVAVFFFAMVGLLRKIEIRP
ncbi:hypothetical protein IV102_35880 [bacterium]|nr:hypothetical protein [bacterium]